MHFFSQHIAKVVRSKACEQRGEARSERGAVCYVRRAGMCKSCTCADLGCDVLLMLSDTVVPAQVEALVGSSSKGSCLGGLVAGGAGSCVCCLLYTSPSPRDRTTSRMPSSA